uniref:Uncharacterized protein n=1 Tax=Anguilla anguilla TaxID=7936 RepID=A0A0E9PF63_ANGAN
MLFFLFIFFTQRSRELIIPV